MLIITINRKDSYFLLYFRNNEKYIKTSVEISEKKLKQEKACDSQNTIEKQANVGTCFVNNPITLNKKVVWIKDQTLLDNSRLKKNYFSVGHG